ncbi:hypothetical protein F5Y16DRAFT_245318 [Xylariaceae sp. FL0255]|nr:hypothetical protein F5Y16DRAFT_245318 [Xylariaceae sp. FL0255]
MQGSACCALRRSSWWVISSPPSCKVPRNISLIGHWVMPLLIPAGVPCRRQETLLPPFYAVYSSLAISLLTPTDRKARYTFNGRVATHKNIHISSDENSLTGVEDHTRDKILSAGSQGRRKASSPVIHPFGFFRDSLLTRGNSSISATLSWPCRAAKIQKRKCFLFVSHLSRLVRKKENPSAQRPKVLGKGRSLSGFGKTCTPKSCLKKASQIKNNKPLSLSSITRVSTDFGRDQLFWNHDHDEVSSSPNITHLQVTRRRGPKILFPSFCPIGREIIMWTLPKVPRV